MSYANEVFDMLNSIDINVAKLGKITNYDSSKSVADIKIIADSSMLINVPVMCFKTNSFFIKVPLQKDDLVLVIFLDYDSDNILIGHESIASDRQHDLSDAICLGGINLVDNVIDNESNDLVIGNSTANISIKESGDVHVKANNIIFNGNVTGI